MYIAINNELSKLQMIDAFRVLIPYSKTLSHNLTFDAYFTGHESGSRHAWGYAGMEGGPPYWPDDGPEGELMEPDEDEQDPAVERPRGAGGHSGEVRRVSAGAVGQAGACGRPDKGPEEPGRAPGSGAEGGDRRGDTRGPCGELARGGEAGRLVGLKDRVRRLEDAAEGGSASAPERKRRPSTS